MNNKKVYIVTCWHDYLTKYDDDIFMNFVVANNEEEARQIVEDNISEEAAEVLLDQLFEDDDTLEDVVGMPASKAIDEINKELSSRSIHKKVLNKGKNVNVEFDILAKYVEKNLLSADNSNITMNFLERNGFV